MPVIIDAEKPITKHPAEILYWTMPFTLKENEAIEATPAPAIIWYPSGSDYDLVIDTPTIADGNMVVRVAGGRLHEHFIAEFTVTTTENGVVRKRVLRGRIEIV